MSLLPLFLIAGVLIGYLRPLSAGGSKINQLVVSIGLFVLLASMGARLGADRTVLRHLERMGLQAVVLAAASVAGSVLLVHAGYRLSVRRRFLRGARRDEGPGKPA